MNWCHLSYLCWIFFFFFLLAHFLFLCFDISSFWSAVFRKIKSLNVSMCEIYQSLSVCQVFKSVCLKCLLKCISVCTRCNPEVKWQWGRSALTRQILQRQNLLAIFWSFSQTWHSIQKTPILTQLTTQDQTLTFDRCLPNAAHAWILAYIGRYGRQS